MISVDGRINKSVNQGRGEERVAKELIHISASEGGHGITVDGTRTRYHGTWMGYATIRRYNCSPCQLKSEFNQKQEMVGVDKDIQAPDFTLSNV